MKKGDQGLVGDRYKLVPRTLCFVFCQEDILLLKGAHDKRLWSNRFNGIGGHVERGENVASAVRREIREETGLNVRNLRLCGLITVDVEPQVGILVAVFSAETESRETTPSAEGELAWFHIDSLPEEEMVDDVPALVNRILAAPAGSPPFAASYSYDPEGELTVRFAE